MNVDSSSSSVNSVLILELVTVSLIATLSCVCQNSESEIATGWLRHI